MKIRNGAGTSYEQKKFQSMTASAQKQNAQYKNTGLAYYAKGTVFTAQEIRQNGSSWWARTPSGWICLADSKKVYCQKK
jgi:hypothetical protein